MRWRFWNPRSFARSWNTFFFKPQSPTPVALYRILYGLVMIINLALQHEDWLTWYGNRGFVSMETLRKLSPGLKPSLFWIMPQNDAFIQAFFWVFLLLAVFLTLGFLSRFSSVAVFICLGSIHRRNPFILNGGDALLRAFGFFLMFAPTDAAISVDRLWRIWRGKEGLEVRARSPWAQRMIQIQTSVMYLSTFAWKTAGSAWMNGTALYYTTRLEQFQRFPIPVLENGILLKMTTWVTVATEGAVGALVWVRKLRYWILLLGVCLHLGIEYSMNIQLFQWITLSAYVTFIEPADLSRIWGWLRRHMAGLLGDPVDAIYDGSWTPSLRLANVLRAVDVLGRLNVVDSLSSAVRTAWPELSERPAPTLLMIGTHGSLYEGFRGLQVISRRVPLLWPLAPLSLFYRFSGQRKLLVTGAKTTK